MVDVRDLAGGAPFGLCSSVNVVEFESSIVLFNDLHDLLNDGLELSG